MAAGCQAVVVRVRGGERLAPGSVWGSWFYTSRGGACDFAPGHAITTGSSYAAKYLPSRLSGRARIIPLGVQSDAFRPPPERPPGPPWRLLQVADINLVKDQDTLLRALRLVTTRVPDVSMDFIGEDTRDGHLRRLADSLGLTGRVRFHGFLPQRRLAAFYLGAHLHVMSSRYESQGVSVLEAAACGLPTVGTAVGLLPELSPGAARSVTPGDFKALAERLSEVTPCRFVVDSSWGTQRCRGASAHDARWTAKSFEEVYASVRARH